MLCLALLMRFHQTELYTIALIACTFCITTCFSLFGHHQATYIDYGKATILAIVYNIYSCQCVILGLYSLCDYIGFIGLY
jgi:hypothetical protein